MLQICWMILRPLRLFKVRWCFPALHPYNVIRMGARDLILRLVMQDPCFLSVKNTDEG